MHVRALRNGLKRLELAKVGLIANPMQNSIRNMIGILFLMCDGLIVNKPRILDGLWKGDFNLEGIWDSHYYMNSLLVSSLQVTVFFIVHDTTVTTLPPFSTGIC